MLTAMAPKRPFDLLYDAEAVQHLYTIERRYHALIRNTIVDQLSFEPLVETRNSKS
jgi:hypothetical protein